MRVERGKGIRLFGVGFLFLIAGLRPALAQGPGRLTEFDYFLLGLRVRPDPPAQVVPKNTPTGLRLALDASSASVSNDTLLALLPPGLEVAAELVGPGIDTPIQLRGQPGDLLPIPALVTRGVYLVRDLRLVKPDGTTFLRALPDTATVEVIEQILITQVTTRPLTDEEIRQRGIIIGDDSFHGFDFTIAFRLDNNPVNLTLSAIFDSHNVPVPLQTTGFLDIGGAGVPGLGAAVVPIMLEAVPPENEGGGMPDLPPVPGLLVIPGNVGFLNQFFSALLLVSNGAPEGARLFVTDLEGRIILPAGDDQVSGTTDDPLQIAETADGRLSILPLVGPGPDGVQGTSDDTVRLGPREHGQAEFLLEGKKEGFHEISFDISGTLDGLPVGPVKIRGKARGGVLVRNPSFHMTFSTPATVRAGEEFNLYVTVANVSTSALANRVRVRLGPGLAGARVIPKDGDEDGDPAFEEIPTIRPGDAEVLSFRFVSSFTGQVTASYLKFDQDPHDKNTGELRFHLGVGERGVPLSPDMLVLPKSADLLPPAVVTSALRVLGLGWSIATAPTGALPRGVARVRRQAVVDRALELAEAGLRVQLGESLANALSEVAFSWNSADDAFDQLLRQRSGAAFFNSIGAALSTEESETVPVLHRALEDSFTSQPAHVSIGFGNGFEEARVNWRINDEGGRSLDSSTTRELPHAAFLPLAGSGRGLVLLNRLTSTRFQAHFVGTPPGGLLDLSVGVPLSEGGIDLHAFSGVLLDPGVPGRLDIDLSFGAPRVTFEIDSNRDGVFEPVASFVETLLSRGPQLRAAAVVGPETLTGADPWGRVAALVFDREVRSAEANDRANFRVDANAILSARRQLSGRLVFLFLRDPVSDLVTRQVSVSGLLDEGGEPMTPPAAERSITSLLEDDGAIVSGRVLQADGTPVASAKLLYQNSGGAGPVPISLKDVASDGSYSLDYVRRSPYGPFFMKAFDPATGGSQQLSTSVRAHGEHIVVDLVLLGRGGVRGVVTRSFGPAAGAKVLVLSQTDPTSFALVTTDAEGRYEAAGLVVGPVTVKAVQGAFAGIASGIIERAGTSAVIDVSLDDSGGQVSGTVAEIVGDARVPIPRTKAYYVLRHSPRDLVIAVTETLDDGTYRFRELPVGAFYVLVIDDVTKRQATAPGTNAGQDIESLDVVFFPAETGVIQGTVVTASGEFIDADVVAAGRRVNAVGGRFELLDVPVGPHVVQARRAGSSKLATTSVVVRAGETAFPVLRFTGTGTVKVLVRDALGSLLFGQQVIRTVASACTGESQTTSAVDGVATFHDVEIPGGTFKSVNGQDVVSEKATIRHDGEEALLELRFRGFGTVKGQVFEGDGFAHGAIVTLGALRLDGGSCGFVQDPRARQLRADTQGEFEFKGIPVSEFTVSVQSAITGAQASARDVLVAPGELRDLRFSLSPDLAGVLSGRVVLPSGHPAGPGISVTASAPGRRDVTVVTATDGSFAFARVLPPGTYTLTATDPLTGAANKINVALRKDEDFSAELQLLARGTVEVKVIDGAGALAKEAFVELARSSFPFDRAAGTITEFDQGVIRFPGISAGNFTVTASDRLGRGGRASGELFGEGTTLTVTVSLTVTGTVRGVFKTLDGSRAIPNAEVRLAQGTAGRLLGSTTTSSDPSPDKLGRFEFRFVPAGTVLATAIDPVTGRVGEASGRIRFQDDVIDLEIRPLGLGRVSGVVTRSGSPQPAAIVRLTSGTQLIGQPNLQATATTGTDGGFEFEGVPVGSFTLHAEVPGLQLIGQASGRVDAEGDDERVDIRLEPSGSVRGTVYRADRATTVPGARITLKTPKGSLTARSDLEGSYRFDFVLAGDVELTAEEVAGSDAGIAFVTVRAGEETSADIFLNGTGKIEGVALDSDGVTRITGGVVRLERLAPFPRSESVEIRPDGSFQFLAVPVGDFSLKLEISGSPLRGTFLGTLAQDGDVLAVEIRLADAGTVFGTVVRQDGIRSVPNALVTTSGSGFTLSDLTDPSGRFRIDGVPVGSFTVRVEDPVSGGVAVATGSVIANGEEVDLGRLQLDEVPLAVESISPDGGVPVPPDTDFIVRFTKPVARESVLGRVVVHAAGGTVRLRFAFSSDDLTLTASPDPSLPPNGSVSFVVGRDVQDKRGRKLGENVPKSYTVSGAVVVGTVRNGTNPVADATVVFRSASVLRTTTSNVAGQYRFEDLPFNQGSTELVTVEAESMGLKGRSSGSFASSGKITLDVTVSATGSVSGTIFHADGSHAPGVRVRINRSLGGGIPNEVFSNAQGSYAFDFVPLGSFRLDVTELPTGDRGRGEGFISAIGENVVLNVTLAGFGRLIVTVQDSNGRAQPEAVVEVRNRDFGSFESHKTENDGVATFNRVLAGELSVAAVGPTGLKASVITVLKAGETKPITLRLQPSGTIRGVVFAPDRVTPVPGALVQLTGTKFQQVTSGPDGSFAFEEVPLGSYALKAADFAGRPRAVETGLQVKENNEVLERNLVFIGHGVVRGQVVKAADESPVPSVNVSLQSLSPVDSRLFSAITDALGRYEVRAVAEGPFTASVNIPAQKLGGEKSGVVTRDGEEVVADIRLLDNSVTLPATRWDANSVPFDVQRDGSLKEGLSAFNPFGLLDIFLNGAQNSFPASFLTGITEEDGREIVLLPRPVAGLEVSRKVLVPRFGYFARYLEILRNPGTLPITVDVRVSSTVRSGSGSPRIITTSSGDTTLSVADAANPDRWVVIDDGKDVDPFLDLSSNLPSLAFVFDGPKGALRAGSATFPFSQLSYRWNAVTIPPGETVVLAHFVVQQVSQAAARASAERLIQLPPEALSGLDGAEPRQIGNFTVPADGTSPLQPLPPTNGIVSGYIFAGDGKTPLSGIRVEMKSQNIFFSRTRAISSSRDGSYAFVTDPSDSLFAWRIAVDSFDLLAVDTATDLKSRVTGSFAGTFDGNLSLGSVATASSTDGFNTPDRAIDGYFSSLWRVTANDTKKFLDVTLPPQVTVTAVNVRGQTEGRFLRGRFELFDESGAPLFAQESNLTDTTSDLDLDVPDSTDVKRVRFTGFNATTTTSGVTELQVIGSGVLPKLARRDVTLPESGVVTGTVVRPRNGGEAVVGATVELIAPDLLTRSTTTNQQGAFTIASVPADRTFTIRARHPASSGVFRDIPGLKLNGHGDSLSVNLVLPALATVEARVLRSDQVTPISGKLVFVTTSFGLRNSGQTGVDGKARILNVPEGNFTALAQFRTDELVQGVILPSDDGGIVSVTIVEPFVGTIQGRVFAADGNTPLPSNPVEVLDRATGVRVGSTSSNSNGFYSFGGIQPGRNGFIVRATSGSVSVEREGVFTQNGETVTIDLTLAVSVIRGRVLFSDGEPLPMPSVFITQFDPAAGSRQTFFPRATDANGGFLITHVKEGDFTLLAHDSVSGLIKRLHLVLASASVPVDLDVLLPPSGAVTGTVIDEGNDNQAVPGAHVGLASESLKFTRIIQAEGDGTYHLDRVPLGPFSIQAGKCVRAFQCSAAGRTVGASLTEPGETLTRDLTIPATGTVRGRVLELDGTTFVRSARVRPRNFETFGPLDFDGPPFGGDTFYADQFGNYEATGLPAGTIRLFASCQASSLFGSRSVALAAGETLEVDLLIGDEEQTPQVLIGTDGFLYDVNRNGALGEGGTTNRRLEDAYDGAYELKINALRFPDYRSARLEDSDREIVFQGARIVLVDVTRKVFVPEEGGFARFLDILTNPTAGAVQVDVLVRGNLGADDATRMAVAPSQTSNRYAVTIGGAIQPALAHVFGGPSARVSVDEVEFEQGDDEFFYRWRLTIPARQTAILMHFAVQRDKGDIAAAQTQAEALVNLTDPKALRGMSAGEKSQVINFRIPQ